MTGQSRIKRGGRETLKKLEMDDERDERERNGERVAEEKGG